MKKVLAVLLAVVGVFAFTAVSSAKSCFDPVDEPTTPFERVEYYVSGMTKPALKAESTNSDVYIIGSDSKTVGVVWYSEGIAQVAVKLKNADMIKQVGSEYVYIMQSFIMSVVMPITREEAENFANEIFAMAEEEGFWFRKGYVLYWKRDINTTDR